MSAFALRAIEALRQRQNWLQLGKFVAVGLSGYVINLGIYAALLGWGAHTAAAVSFVISAANNYWWNRHWTFAHTKGSFAYQGTRFFAVSLVALLDSVPDGRVRAAAALANPNAGEVLVSAAPGWEFDDLAGRHHHGGGSHGSLEAADSEVPMLTVGLGAPPSSITEIKALIAGHFGVEVSDGRVSTATSSL